MSTSTRLALVVLLAAAVAAALASAAVTALHAVLALPPHLWGPGHVDDLLVVLLGALGSVGAVWYALSGVLALVTLRTDPLGRGTAARLLAHWGAPYVRRAAAGALATSLVLPGAAFAQETPPAPDDLGWSPTVCATASPGAPESTGAGTDSGTATGTDASALDSTPSSPGGAPPAPCASPGSEVQAPQAAQGPSAAPGDTDASHSSADPGAPAPPDTAAPDGSPSPPAGTPASTSGTASARQPAPDSTVTATAPATTYVVCEGDSLWAITSSYLNGPAPAEVATAWPTLYHANDDVIGQDPDLIRPGTVLSLPDTLTGRS